MNEEHLAAEELFGPEGLTRMSNTFHRRDVVFAVAAAHAGGLATLEQAERWSTGCWPASQVVKIDHPTKPLYTTVELVECEQQILDHARNGRDLGSVWWMSAR